MIENKEELQLQVSELIHQDIVKIVTSYSQTSLLKLDDIVSFVQDVNLLNIYDVEYIHNNELNEIISILNKELKVTNTQNMTLLITFDYLLKKENNYKQALYVNLFEKIPHEEFMNVFAVFAVLNSTVKDLFSDFMIYIFNDGFLDLKEKIQIDYIYKGWNFSQQIFHDNEASQFAYSKLKILFDKALEKEKTEVAFWLYYTPLHYFHSGTDSDINKVNEKFKIEIEKPLEQYIQKKLIPKYDIKPNNKTIDKSKKIKVAFVMQRIIKHSTVNVFYSLVKSLMKDKNKEYEFIIYDIAFAESGGSVLSFVDEFKKLGIKYINLHTKIFGNMSPTYSLLEKCLKTREILIKDDIDIFIGLHTRVEYIFLYATRTAPKQIYWYHSSNAQYDIDGIDIRITHGSIPQVKYKFVGFPLPINEKLYNPIVNNSTIETIRNQYPKKCFILGTIGRLVKVDNEEFLNTIATILKQNPNTIYLLCGSGDQEKIKLKIEQLGILERVYFSGHINSHEYGHVIDLFLAPFPNGGGESLDEYRYKGKPYVVLSDNSKNIKKNKDLEQLTNDIKNNKAYGFKSSLYTDKDLALLNKKGFLTPLNTQAQSYLSISFVIDSITYISVANEYIKNKILRNKSTDELLYHLHTNLKTISLNLFIKMLKTDSNE